MPTAKREGRSRQIYASIREDLYLAAKARATELRIQLRKLVELALERTLTNEENVADVDMSPSIWDDEYLRMQAEQPLGSPIELTREEAGKVLKNGF